MSNPSPPSEPQSADRVADALPANWVDRYAPKPTRPYLRLARFDRPIGTWLLLLPCWWSLALAAPVSGEAWGPFPDPVGLLLFAIGAIAMRGAGCTYNDIVDRDYDAQVARTRSRPLPSGAVSLKAAWAFLIAQCLVGAGVLFSFNRFAILLGLGSLIVVAIYPFMKRVTHWPQAVLGLAFNWGALLGYAYATASSSASAVLLYVGAIAWTIGYDTIYAHQDKEDDALIGLKSTALKFGEATPYWLTGFYLVMALFVLAAGYLAGLGWGFYPLYLAMCGHLAWQIASLRMEDPAHCLKLFKSNRNLGLILLAAMIAGSLTTG